MYYDRNAARIHGYMNVAKRHQYILITQPDLTHNETSRVAFESMPSGMAAILFPSDLQVVEMADVSFKVYNQDRCEIARSPYMNSIRWTNENNVPSTDFSWFPVAALK